MTRNTSSRRPGRSLARARSLAAPALLVPVLALAVAGCGGGSGGSSGGSAPNGAAPSNAANGGNGGNGGGRGPAAFGKIAAASDGTLQVQGSDSQTTVTYTSSTRFTQTVTGTVAVGDCVTANGTPVSGSTTALTATSVRIISSGSATCSMANERGTRPSGGAMPSGAPGRVRPSGANGARPSGAPNGTNFATAYGKVTAVAGSTVTVEGTLRTGFGGARPSGSAAPTATPSATTLTVTLGSSATVTKTVEATSAAATVGQCASAEGSTDDTGAVKATSIAISAPTSNGCTGGFGRFGGAGNGAGNGGSNG